MKIYHYRPEDGHLICEGFADPDPMVDGNWLIPAYATTVEPLPFQENKTIHLINGIWEYKDVVLPPIPSPEPELNYAEKRAAEYPSFADQFDLLYHGGIDAWKSVIQAVKDKYPKV